MTEEALIPLPVRFSSSVHLTIHQAFLSCAGVLLSDPVARVHVVTVRTSHGDRVVQSAREVGKTQPCFFTAHPSFEASFDFTVAESSALTSFSNPPSSASSPLSGARHRRSSVNMSSRMDREAATSMEVEFAAGSVVDYVVITVEAADGTAFYGEAYAPFSPHCSSMTPATAPVKVMLAPRNAQDPTDPLFVQDSATLTARNLDDFGFVTLSWEVTVNPRGGALLGAATPPAESSSQMAAVFPVGLTLRATWLARAAVHTPGAQYTTSVDFGSVDRFLFPTISTTPPLQVDGQDVPPQHQHEQHPPLCLTLQGSAADAELRRATFHCSVQSPVDPTKSHDVAVTLPLPPLRSAYARDRDVHWTAPVRTSSGLDLGLLLVSMRVSSQPLPPSPPRCAEEACPRINDARHQEDVQHIAHDFGTSSPPQTPPGAYQPIAWESAAHVAEAEERRWRLQCVREARPTVEHVRHLFDVLMGRATLDPAVAAVVATARRVAPAELTAGILREVMVTFAFHATALTVQAAARFCFVALRRDVADAVAAEELVYMVDHCLLERTVDMPAQERRRWVRDLFGDAIAVTYADFATYLLHNYALWAAFGVSLRIEEATSSLQRQHSVLRVEGRRRASSVSGSLVGWGGTQVMDVAALPDAASLPTASCVARSPGATGSRSHSSPRNSSSPSPEWRTFVVRVAQSPSKAFSVTAYAKDTVKEVMAMVEGSAGIKAGQQEWRLASSTTPSTSGGGGSGTHTPRNSSSGIEGFLKVLDPSMLIGNTTLGLPSALRRSSSTGGTSPEASKQQEVWIFEAEASVLLRFRWKDRVQGRKEWQERVPLVDKVLKLRAAVQRRTLIPLSRCVLTVRNSGGGASMNVLQDRHTLAHYHLVSGDVVEVSQE